MTISGSRNIVWHNRVVSRADHAARYGHSSYVIWFTGLSGAGKSTLAHAVEAELFRRGVHTLSLDGDNVRHGLNSDLSFSEDSRRENIRRVGEVARLVVEAGIVVLASFISPFREDRDFVRSLLGPGEFIEVYVRCNLSVCEERDPKGLYSKARAGIIPDFTGVTSPYEEPLSPEIVVDTTLLGIDQATAQVVMYLEKILETNLCRED